MIRKLQLFFYFWLGNDNELIKENHDYEYGIDLNRNLASI